MNVPSYLNVRVNKKHDDTNTRYPNFSLAEYLEDQGVIFKERLSNDHTEFSTNCPKCVERGESRPDTKGRLWVNPKKGTFFCYNCHWDGNLVRLIQHYSNANYEAALKILKGKTPNPLEHLNFTLLQEMIDDEDDRESMSAVDLPYGFKSFEEHPDESVFTAYLEYRGIPLEYAVSHGWGFTETGYTANRIIVPCYQDDELVFWQARDVLEEEHEAWGTKEYRKVLNPRGVSANKVLYNFDNAKEYQEIVLVEGFIDAVKVGDMAVATNGKHLHPAQMDLLTQTKAERICILWDHDAYHDGSQKRKSSVERATALLKAYFEVRTVKLPEGVDAGDYAVGELDSILFDLD